jgi:hypothetical protein
MMRVKMAVGVIPNSGAKKSENEASVYPLFPPTLTIVRGRQVSSAWIKAGHHACPGQFCSLMRRKAACAVACAELQEKGPSNGGARKVWRSAAAAALGSRGDRDKARSREMHEIRKSENQKRPDAERR